MSEIIAHHQNKITLTQSEIEFAVNSFVSGQTSEKEMTDFLLSVVEHDLNEEETFYLTKVMLKSGQVMDLSDFSDTIDKHSTGGVSDSTTLIVVPLFALFGYTCIKMSGGELGHTGGTADKMKVFHGLENSLTQEKTFEIAKKTGACFITSTADIASADKKIYALRDKINAMSVGLIASSIMSKKLACGAKNLILDVKYGSGALLKTKRDALTLARLMTKIGNMHGVNTTYILGDMRQPLGQYIGDTLEVFEVLQNLKNAHMTRLLFHSLNIVATALSKKSGLSKEQVFSQAYEFVKNGKVLAKLKEIVSAQGGSFELISKKFMPAFVVKAKKNGIISGIQTKQLGFLDKQLKKTAKDYQGFKICVELKQKVALGDILFECFFDIENKNQIIDKLQKTIRIKNEN